MLNKEMDIRTIGWTGKNGNRIELKAFCVTKMVEKEIDSDGYIVKCGMEPRTDADLELWVDGKKVDSCWDVNFWRVIDLKEHPGYKKVWGLKLMMTAEQAEKVEAFLESVIEGGKAPEVKAYENEKEAKKQAERVGEAKKVIQKAERTIADTGSLMTNDQAQEWVKNYNNLYNEGGEGYIPEVITQEMYDWAKSIVGK